MDYRHELTAQQRAALVTVRLLRGERLTNAQVADICGYMTRQAAYELMMQLAGLHEGMAVTFAQGMWFILDK